MVVSGGRRNGGSRRRPEFLLPPEAPSVAREKGDGFIYPTKHIFCLLNTTSKPSITVNRQFFLILQSSMLKCMILFLTSHFSFINQIASPGFYKFSHLPPPSGLSFHRLTPRRIRTLSPAHFCPILSSRNRYTGTFLLLKIHRVFFP